VGIDDRLPEGEHRKDVRDLGGLFGLDRLAAVLAGTDAIREVMAFPKASSGGDPLTGAPTPITREQRKEAGIDVAPA